MKTDLHFRQNPETAPPANEKASDSFGPPEFIVKKTGEKTRRINVKADISGLPSEAGARIINNMGKVPIFARRSNSGSDDSRLVG
ncbi:MAG: hypothetical protein PHH77_08120 [Victivallaceae bacterium]|nr:hypothetical protein [Victivallaceae bacterium]